jgi:hypothetical protein
VIDVTQYSVLAVFAQDLFCLVSGQAIGAFVPVENLPIPVNEIHAIADVIQQLFIEIRVGRNNRIVRLVRFDKASQRLFLLSHPARASRAPQARCPEASISSGRALNPVHLID